jgi:hypothetical protein
MHFLLFDLKQINQVTDLIQILTFLMITYYNNHGHYLGQCPSRYFEMQFLWEHHLFLSSLT